ncbi:hypothetical protein NDU88_005901, partial [Pleurodeles waltl]
VTSSEGECSALPLRAHVCLVGRLGPAKHNYALGFLQPSNTVAGLERACTRSQST